MKYIQSLVLSVLLLSFLITSPHTAHAEKWIDYPSVGSSFIELPNIYDSKEPIPLENEFSAGEGQLFLPTTSGSPIIMMFYEVPIQDDFPENLFELEGEMESYAQGFYHSIQDLLQEDSRWETPVLKDMKGRRVLILSGSLNNQSEVPITFHNHYLIQDGKHIYILSFLYDKKKSASSRQENRIFNSLVLPSDLENPEIKRGTP